MRSPLFLLGISSPQPTGGMRSLLAFWAGGAMSGTVTPEPAPVVSGSNDDGIYLKQRIRDDDELAQLLTIIFPHL